jgi:adenosine deaminase
MATSSLPNSFFYGLPKAELHLHIEGTLEPELIFQIAQRNGISLKFPSVEALRAAYEFTDLQSFLDIYYQGTDVLIKDQDFYDMTWAYLERANKNGVKHAEIFFDPQSHTVRGVSFETVVKGIHRALTDAKEKLGLSTHLILCFLRHLSEEDAMKTFEEALPFLHLLKGVGLDSGEKGNPPSKFREVFDRALKHGLLTVAHAGEEGPPAYILEALELLHVSRIDHGLRCLEDDEVVKILVEKRVPLTVCPLSNVKLRGVEDISKHPIKTLLQRGLVATINSDDPAYFGGYVAENFIASHEHLHFSAEEIYHFAKNSFVASFITNEEREGFVSALNNYYKAHQLPIPSC